MRHCPKRISNPNMKAIFFLYGLVGIKLDQFEHMAEMRDDDRFKLCFLLVNYLTNMFVTSVPDNFLEVKCKTFSP